MKIPCTRVVTLIGSRPGCKLTIPDKHVAPVHVALVNDGEQVLAVDLVTPGGTLLHGLKMELETLKDGDVFGMGRWEFQAEIKPPEHGGLDDARPFGLEPEPQVVALEHVSTGRLLQPNRTVCVIGRRSGCDVTITDNRISRVHAILFRYFGHPAIFDLHSKHPVSVNDVQVGFKLLKNGDKLVIGESQFKVHMATATIGEKPSTNGKPKRKIVRGRPAPAPPAPSVDGDPLDLINIAETERSQTWRIADRVKKRITGK